MRVELYNEVYEATLRICRSRPDVLGELLRIIGHEHSNPELHGWSYDDLDPPLKPQLLYWLHLNGLLRKTYESKRKKRYALRDRPAVLEALSDFVGEEDDTIIISRALFDDVEGFEDLKELIVRAVNSGTRVHFLFVGPPSCAKTLFLLCLERLPRVGYFLGSRTTKAGFAEFLLLERPRIVLVDELDKMNRSDYAVLLSLCETGRVVKHVKGDHIDVELDTVVFACANDRTVIPAEVLSRFEVMEFPAYTREEFINICINILTRRENADPDTALYIGKQVWDELRSRDIREAVRVARMCHTRTEVAETIETLKKYRQDD